MFDNIKQFYNKSIEFLNRIRSRKIGPKLYDRENQTFIYETIPIYIWLEDEIMYSYPFDVIDHWQIIRNLLRNENIHEDHKYNKYSSASKIPKFIDFYNINMSDFELENPNMYKTFNDFFIREIKTDKRPIADLYNGSIINSPADCRLTVFDSLMDAHKLYIKGKKFTLTSLLFDNISHNDLLKADVLSSHFDENSSTANFRLAPMDYHHFHSPVSGNIKYIYHIQGQYFTVKPKALNSNINVLGENTRTIICIDTEQYGYVLFVAIGAEKVGTVKCSVSENQYVSKGDKLGFFEYGGSDILVLFENKIKWDQDIYEMSQKSIETLIHFGINIGAFTNGIE